MEEKWVMVQSYGTFINVDGGRLGALKTAPESYESSVIELLKHIGRFQVGWHVLNAIKKTGKRVLIRPGEVDMATHLNPVVVAKPYVVNLICRYGYDWDCPEEMQERVFDIPHRLGEVYVFFRPD
jgi:hypothetical protein